MGLTILSTCNHNNCIIMLNDICYVLLIFRLDCECIKWVEVNIKSMVTQFSQYVFCRPTSRWIFIDTHCHTCRLTAMELITYRKRKRSLILKIQTINTCKWYYLHYLNNSIRFQGFGIILTHPLQVWCLSNEFVT